MPAASSETPPVVPKENVSPKEKAPSPKTVVPPKVASFKANPDMWLKAKNLKKEEVLRVNVYTGSKAQVSPKPAKQPPPMFSGPTPKPGNHLQPPVKSSAVQGT